VGKSGTRTRFRRLRKISKNDYYLRHVCLHGCVSVSPSALNNSPPIGGIFMKFDI
jgi:hypothetical protein